MEFAAEANSAAALPRAVGPEVAVAGRSNVGKSSLINSLLGRRRLARTSRTPGCTRGLIFYAINERLRLVDLPGFGYAKRSRSERAEWKKLVEGYLSDREELVAVLILIDVRRGPQTEEVELGAFLDEAGVPWLWVLTKCDKLSRAKTQTAIREISAQTGDVPVYATSSNTGAGVKELWACIDEAWQTALGSEDQPR